MGVAKNIGLVIASSVSTETNSQRLLDLQWSQLKHDESFHKEICALSVADRLKHFALHMAKYVGYIATALDSEDKELFERSLIDAFIISLASANTLSIDLGEELACGKGCAANEVRALGENLLVKFPRLAEDPIAFLRLMARYTGSLAKACEALDHVENHPFRGAMSAAVLDLFQLVVAEGAALNFNLVENARRRLEQIESKNIFYRYL